MIITSSYVFFKRFCMSKKNTHTHIPLLKMCSFKWVNGRVKQENLCLLPAAPFSAPCVYPPAPAHIPVSVIYTHAGFMLEDKLFVIRKLLEPRKRISFPVHLVVNLPKNPRQIKSPYRRAVWCPRGRWESFLWTCPHSDLSSILKSSPAKLYLVQLSADFITNCGLLGT